MVFAHLVLVCFFGPQDHKLQPMVFLLQFPQILIGQICRMELVDLGFFHFL